MLAPLAAPMLARIRARAASVRLDSAQPHRASVDTPSPSAVEPSRALPRELASDVPGIRFWWGPLDRTPEEVARDAASLSDAERLRAQRFGTDALRHRWIAGRTTLRKVLGAVLGIAPAEVAIRRGTRGRPELVDASAGIDFNVSHTQNVAVIGIARGLDADARIGVDVEANDRIVGADRLARKFLTAREQATLAGLSFEQRRERFLRYWTCKEAMSKATSDGLSAPFRCLDVEIGEALRLADGPPPYDPPRWELRTIDVPPGWLATLAIWRRAA